MSASKKYTLTLHKKSYLLKGVSKDDPVKEDVKKAGAKWNGSLGGWLFFPKEHEAGLKLAKKIKAKIDVGSEQKEGVSEDSDEVKDEGKRKSGDDDKYKQKYKKLKKEVNSKCIEFGELLLKRFDTIELNDDHKIWVFNKHRTEMLKSLMEDNDLDIQKFMDEKEKHSCYENNGL